MTFASANSSSCGTQGAVGDRSAATRCANSRGAMYLKLLCGRSSLYSSFHVPIFARASSKFANQLAFKHSSRNFPWKLSTYAFCAGRPGSMCTKSIFRSIPHAQKCRLVNSGPLSHPWDQKIEVPTRKTFARLWRHNSTRTRRTAPSIERKYRKINYLLILWIGSDRADSYCDVTNRPAHACFCGCLSWRPGTKAYWNFY